MLLHLDMDEASNLLLMEPQHLPCIVFGEIRQEVTANLFSQIVKKIGVLVVGYVVKVD